jgi:serine/threonine protein kinase
MGRASGCALLERRDVVFSFFVQKLYRLATKILTAFLDLGRVTSPVLLPSSSPLLLGTGGELKLRQLLLTEPPLLCEPHKRNEATESSSPHDTSDMRRDRTSPEDQTPHPFRKRKKRKNFQKEGQKRRSWGPEKKKFLFPPSFFLAWFDGREGGRKKGEGGSALARVVLCEAERAEGAPGPVSCVWALHACELFVVRRLAFSSCLGARGLARMATPDPAEGGKNDRPKTIIDKALDGTASSTEFKDFISSFINDQNSLNLRSTHCSLSSTSLDFSNSGNLVPVVPYEEMTQPDAKCVHASITLSNNAGKRTARVFFEVCCKANPKFRLSVSEMRGTIKPGKSVTLNFQLQVFCTTKVYQMLKISLSREKPRSWGKQKIQSGHQVLGGDTDQALDHELGRLWVAFKIESELSNQIDWNEIEIGSKIAKGGFGTVFKGTWRGSEVAVKLLNTQELVDEEKEMVKREMVLMSRLASPYMVTYMGSTLLPGQPWSIIMEFVSGGSLTDLLETHNARLTLKFKVKLLMDIVAGMTYLHAHSIWHRDIKPDNMLVLSAHETGVNLKITDFGTSKASAKKGGLNMYESFDFKSASAGQTPPAQGEEVLAELNRQHANEDSNVRKVTRGVGTLIYQAPEIIEGSDSLDIDKTDVYAFAILMWQVYTAVEPYSVGATAKFSKWELEDYVKKGNRPEIPSDMPQAYRKIMQDCWAQAPQMRPVFADIGKELKTLFDSLSGQLGILPEQVGPSTKQVELQNGIPVPVGNLAEVGWGGDIGRGEAEQKLASSPPGTFVIRWSGNTNSYVLSYSKGRGAFQHIAYIQPVPPEFVKIQVDKEDGRKQEYEDIFHYCKAMRESGIITSPCNMVANHGDTYAHTPY